MDLSMLEADDRHALEGALAELRELDQEALENASEQLTIAAPLAAQNGNEGAGQAFLMLARIAYVFANEVRE